MTEYRPRLVDSTLELWLKTFGAVSLEGPRWTGKTMTCEQFAASAVYLSRRPSDQFDPLEMAKLNPSFLFEGAKPRLIDEWQLMSEIWDMVRGDIDANHGAKGMYLLTSSSLPPQFDSRRKDAVRHSGTGRIGRLRMSTMTLYETGDSSGEVSILSLFRGEDIQGSVRGISLDEITHYIVRGGWPANLEGQDSSIMPRAYIEDLISQDLESIDADLDGRRFRRLLLSLARNESTLCPSSRLAADAGNGRPLDDSTVRKYLSVLDHLYLICDQEAFSPSFRSRTRLRIATKRHLADPSLAAAIVGADEVSLKSDLQYLGFLFESLVDHDLRVYIEHLGGHLSHYQDYGNCEVDAVLSLPDGNYGLVEIRLGAHHTILDEAAGNLLRVSRKLEKEASFLAIISGLAPIPMKRKDGVYVIPLTSLKP